MSKDNNDNKSKKPEISSHEPVDISHYYNSELRIANPRLVFRGLTYGQWQGVG